MPRNINLIELYSGGLIVGLEISKIIGKKEFYVKKMLERLYIYSLDDICSLITSLADIDNKLKNGEANIDLLELYILKNN